MQNDSRETHGRRRDDDAVNEHGRRDLSTAEEENFADYTSLSCSGPDLNGLTPEENEIPFQENDS